EASLCVRDWRPSRRRKAGPIIASAAGQAARARSGAGRSIIRTPPPAPWRESAGTHSPPKGERMITKFDSLYAGHVDMDDIGYGGPAVNSRTYPNEHLVTVLEKTRSLARLLDRTGYDTFWL